MFAAGFRVAAQPQLVAETILTAITTRTTKLRWLVGSDAIGLATGGARFRTRTISPSATTSKTQTTTRAIGATGIDLL
jgi:hypothetical protein